MQSDKNLVQLIQKELNFWVSSHKCDLISAKRVLPTSIVAAALFDSDDMEQIFAFGASTLWLFGVDRWFDEKKYVNQDVAKKFDFLFKSVVHVDKEITEIQTTFESLRSVLSRFDSFKFWQHHWINSLTNVLFLGMSSERVHKTTASLDQYLYYGRESIGVKFVNLTTFISMDIPLKFEHYIYFDSLQNLSAEIIRLMNDIVTNPKELLEGKQNALSVLKNFHQNPTEKINSVIIDKQAELFGLIDTGPNELEAFSSYVKNLVVTTLAFYRQSDFYDEDADLKQKHIGE